MSKVTIPDTDVFKDKILNVANTYHHYVLFKLVDALQKELGHEEDHSLKSLTEIDESDRAMMELMGYPFSQLTDKICMALKINL